ncbi:MAG: protein kinase [Pirellulaceae bacterium]|nr:protein kinase [Pirellulaceae bacterium]
MNPLSDSTKYGPQPNELPLTQPAGVSTAGLSSSPQDIQWDKLATNRFQPQALLGRGGFAMVYRAYDQKLRRDVALKIPHVSWANDRSARKWMQREGLATAALQHDHIVRLHDFEVTDEACYLVSDLVDGFPLSQWIERHADGCEPRQAAEITLYIAQALAHAHSKRVLHRDIKPANILLDVKNNVGQLPFSPRLADFGLATAPSQESLSHSAQGLIGSVHYMPPEVVKGTSEGYTVQGDIYALGIVLREMLTGQRAACGASYSEILYQIVHGDLADLGRCTKVPRDLVAICMRATDINPHRRYASADLFAQDLENFLEGRNVRARTPNVVERGWRWSRRHPAIATTSILIMIAVIVFISLLVIHEQRMSRLNALLDKQNANLAAALQNSQAARWHNEQIIYAQDMARASEEFKRGDLRSVRAILEHYQSDQPLHVHRDIDWHMLTKDIQKYRPQRLWQAPHALYAGCFSADGRTLFSAGASSQITALDVATGLVQSQWDSQQREINCLLLNSDQCVLWSTGDDGTVCAWDCNSHQLIWKTLAFAPGNEAHELIYLEELDRLVVHGRSDDLSFLAAQDGRLLTELPPVSGKVATIASLPDGRHFLAGNRHEQLFRIDGTDMRVVQELPLGTKSLPRTPEVSTRVIKVSPDGRWALVVSNRNVVFLVDLKDFSLTDAAGYPESIRNVCFVGMAKHTQTAENRHFWVISRSGVFWEYKITERSRLSVQGNWSVTDERIFSAITQPTVQDQQVFTLGADGNVFQWSNSGPVWQFVSPLIHGQRHCHLLLAGQPLDNQPTNCLFFQSNHDSLDIFSQSHPGINLYVRTRNAALCIVPGAGLYAIEQPNLARFVSWSALDQALKTARPSIEPQPTELDWQDWSLPYRADEFSESENHLRLVGSDEGQWLAGWDAQASVVWCTPPGRSDLAITTSADEVGLIWFEPNSQCCWYVAKHREIYRWKFADGSPPEHITTLRNLPAKDLAISPDKNLLAIMCDDECCFLYNLNEKKIVKQFIHTERLRDVTFSATGKTLIALSEYGRVVCWNLASGRQTYEQHYQNHQDQPVLGGFSRYRLYLVRSWDDGNGWRIEQLTE